MAYITSSEQHGGWAISLEWLGAALRGWHRAQTERRIERLAIARLGSLSTHYLDDIGVSEGIEDPAPLPPVLAIRA
jgi:hypothetical protein